jgi:hypothetical protein
MPDYFDRDLFVKSLVCGAVFVAVLCLTGFAFAALHPPTQEAEDSDIRLQVLFNQSEDIGQLREEWSRLWFSDAPSHLTPERVDGGIMP